MRFHKAGNAPILLVALLMLVLAVAICCLEICFNNKLIYLFLALPLMTQIWAFSFFRYPDRSYVKHEEGKIYSSADGIVVLVEKIPNHELLGNCIQISVFMSIYNVHLNYIPVSGQVVFSKHKAGKHILAENPKASMLNEQAETLIETTYGKKILVRQIAGAAARRVLTFVRSSQEVKVGDELGFIRFGSRVDILLPDDSNVLVRAGNIVKGNISVLAELHRSE